MPARSIKQRNLMAAAEHGAKFPMAKKVASSMTHSQMHDFAATTNAQIKSEGVHAPGIGMVHPHSMLARHRSKY